jgi:A/G-specific adenine glycosylase
MTDISRDIDTKVSIMMTNNTTLMTDKKFVETILKHYRIHGRHDLVWRKNITPYRILVSEIMLQQTQVTRVLPKFMSWMKTYPTLSSLSNSNLKDILILWQGLGYQRRAKALHTIAQSVRVLPKTFDELLMLRGVGTYTASAVMAFAYDTFSHPVLETNIRTVLIEEFHPGEENIHDGMLYDDLTRLEKLALVQKTGARNWYYALMDYGAHLKENKVSHNKKSAYHAVQSKYEGSLRQLRAKVLFAITHGEGLPQDERLEEVLSQLLKETFIKKVGRKYIVV